MTAQIYNIFYNAEKQLVFMDWNGYATSDQFRAGTELMLKLVQEHSASKVVADAKDMVLISREDQLWLADDFFPRLIGAGCKTVAVVSSHHYFNKVAIETISLKAEEKNLLCKVFHNLTSAEEWIESIEL